MKPLKLISPCILMDSKKTEVLKDKELEVLEEDDVDEEVIEKPKFKPRKEHKKVEWVMTPARAEALKKAQEKLKERNQALKEAKALKEEEDRKVIEEKVIAKAIAIKKRQLKKEAVIDEIPVEVPRRTVQKPVPKPVPAPVETYVPKYKFY